MLRHCRCIAQHSPSTRSLARTMICQNMPLVRITKCAKGSRRMGFCNSLCRFYPYMTFFQSQTSSLHCPTQSKHEVSCSYDDLSEHATREDHQMRQRESAYGILQFSLPI